MDHDRHYLGSVALDSHHPHWHEHQVLHPQLFPPGPDYRQPIVQYGQGYTASALGPSQEGSQFRSSEIGLPASSASPNARKSPPSRRARRATSSTSLRRGSVTASAASRPSSKQAPNSNPTPRKTLSDADRRRMCRYSEDHPDLKQVEIGEIFGVERSTVSKVLGQKEKYLVPEEEVKSPQKKPKGRYVDVVKALAVWAKNKEKKEKITLSDGDIKFQARYFLDRSSSKTVDPYFNIDDATWLERFKVKNGVGDFRSSTKLSTSSKSPQPGKERKLTSSPSHHVHASTDSPPESEVFGSQAGASSPARSMALSQKSSQTEFVGAQPRSITKKHPVAIAPMVTPGPQNTTMSIPSTVLPNFGYHPMHTPSAPAADDIYYRSRIQPYPYSPQAAVYYYPSSSSLSGPVYQSAPPAADPYWSTYAPPPGHGYLHYPSIHHPPATTNGHLYSPPLSQSDAEQTTPLPPIIRASPVTPASGPGVSSSSHDENLAIDRAAEALETFKNFCQSHPSRFDASELEFIIGLDKSRLRPAPALDNHAGLGLEAPARLEYLAPLYPKEEEHMSRKMSIASNGH